MGNYRQGEEVYLVPTLPTAPTIAYKMPLVTIKTPGGQRCEILLPDGSAIWTDVRNLADTRPTDREPRSKNIIVRPKLPDGYAEQRLW